MACIQNVSAVMAAKARKWPGIRSELRSPIENFGSGGSPPSTAVWPVATQSPRSGRPRGRHLG